MERPVSSQRFHIRTYRRIPLQATVYFHNEQFSALGFVWNLSHDGCRVDAEREVLPGTEVSLMLNLPEAGELIEVESAVVAWSRGHVWVSAGIRCDASMRHASEPTSVLSSDPLIRKIALDELILSRIPPSS
jgi:hypothetical protein